MEICEKLILILLPILFGAFFASIIPRKLKEREKFADAAIEFRKILNEQASIINKIDNDYFAADILFSNTVEPYLKKSQITINGFRIYLKGSHLKKFDGAWKEYCDAQNKQEYLDAIATLYKLSKPKWSHND